MSNIAILTYENQFNCSYKIENNLLNTNELSLVYGEENQRKFIGHIKFKIFIEHSIDYSLGTITNHQQLKLAADQIIIKLADKDLNKDIEEFSQEIPTLENIARNMWKWLINFEPKIQGLKAIQLSNSDNFSVMYSEESKGVDNVAGFMV